ncbi:MAG: thiamine pyrophosphate-dependent enzyme [Bacteriovoracaceae bacterium]
MFETYTGGDSLIDTLIDWGVDTIFGLPGDGINGIMEALRKRQDKIRFIQVRHEEAAAFMACGYAKFTGKIGVCLATSGPGGVHLLNGLYDAKFDGAPVLAITGMQYHDVLDTHTQQDIDLDVLFQDVAVYSARVMGPTHIHAVTNLAINKALTYRGVAHVTVPVDFQSEKVDYKKEASKRNVKGHIEAVHARRKVNAPEAILREAAELINKCKRPVILAGRGALGASDEVIALADKIGAPIVKPLLGKAVVPDDHPLTTGGIGLLGTKPSQEAMEECDLLLMVGTSFPYVEFYPQPGQAKAIQIDIDGSRIGLRYPIDVALAGDSKLILSSLLDFVNKRDDRSFLEKAQKGMKKWNETMLEIAQRNDTPIKPQVVAYEFGQRIPENAIVCSDSGTNTTWWARHIPAKKGQMHTCSGTLATMACGLPYAIAAAIAFPDRPVYAFVGDGGFTMLMMEFLTCVKYNLNIKIVVVKNNLLGQIMWEQMVFLGNPEFGCELQPLDFVKFAEACGARGYNIRERHNCVEVLDTAMNLQGPVLIEAEVDPYEAPMPAKVTFEQAKEFAKSLARGTPWAKEIAITSAKTGFREMI